MSNHPVDGAIFESHIGLLTEKSFPSAPFDEFVRILLEFTFLFAVNEALPEQNKTVS
jgi:hypothetical protein